MTLTSIIIKFLEKKKEELYRLENRDKKLKSTTEQLKLLRELYPFYGYNFLKVAFLRDNELVRWKEFIRLLKKDKGRSYSADVESLRAMKVVYPRLKKYDILKVGRHTYTIDHTQ